MAPARVISLRVRFKNTIKRADRFNKLYRLGAERYVNFVRNELSKLLMDFRVVFFNCFKKHSNSLVLFLEGQRKKFSRYKFLWV